MRANKDFLRMLNIVNLKSLFFCIVPLLILCIFFSKNRNKKESKLNVIFKINRIENDLFACTSKEDLKNFVVRHKEVVKKIYKMSYDESDNDTVNRLYEAINIKEMKELYNEVQKNFYNIDDINNDLNIAFNKLNNEHSITEKPLRISTVITGLESILYVDNEDIIISIDSFLAKDSKFKQGQNSYQAKICVRENIVVSALFQFLDQFFVHKNNDTLVSDMIDYGKMLYLIKIITPNICKERIFLYNIEELYEAEDNEKMIWEFFLINKLLYTTDPQIKNLYLSNREFTPEIYKNCPGAIARWIGFNIVCCYIRNNKNCNVKLLLTNSDNIKIFAESKYNP